MKNRNVFLLAAALVGGSFVVSASAAPIIFSVPATISGDSDVSTTGASVVAFDVTGDPATVNGVPFINFAAAGASTTVGTGPAVTTTIAASGGVSDGGKAYGSTSAPFSGLSAGYQTILKAGGYQDAAGGSLSITFNNLTVGQAYQFETFENDSRGGGTATRSETVTGPAGSNTVTLAYNTTQATGGVGQYTIGSFTADSGSEAITFTSTNAQINAFQLRATPEPASLGLLGVGAVGLLARRRKS